MRTARVGCRVGNLLILLRIHTSAYGYVLRAVNRVTRIQNSWTTATSYNGPFGMVERRSRGCDLSATVTVWSGIACSPLPRSRSLSLSLFLTGRSWFTPLPALSLTQGHGVCTFAATASMPATFLPVPIGFRGRDEDLFRLHRRRIALPQGSVRLDVVHAQWL
jgi:hypothetical protein